MLKIFTRTITVFVLMFIGVCFLTGCSQEPPTPVLTNAIPFTDEILSRLAYTPQSTPAYMGENLLSYTDAENNTVIYMYSSPVENSHNFLSETKAGYTANGAYFTKFFPSKLSNDNPITVQSLNSFANIKPFNEDSFNGKLTTKTNIFNQELQCVVYENFFNKGIDYVCYPTAFGVNTEIIVNKHDDKSNSFRIKLELPDAVPDITSPDYIVFKNSKNQSEIVAIVYTPLVKTSENEFFFDNKVELIEKDSNTNTYTVEYTISDSVKSAKYVLNQSVYLYKSKQPDTTLYSDTKDECGHYLSPYMILGKNTFKGDSLSLIRFDDIEKLNISPEQVVSVKYVFRTLNIPDDKVAVSAHAVTKEWCSINTRWKTKPLYDEVPLDVTYVTESGDYMLDITPLFIEMLSNTKSNAIYKFEKGFALTADLNNGELYIASGDMGLFSPVLIITLNIKG